MTTLQTRERTRPVEDATKQNGQKALDKRALADLVLEAVRQVGANELNPPMTSDPSPAFQPRALLAMLTYCYANRVYGSDDIEEMMREDAAFRALCGREYPDGRQLRRFRRHNQALLKRALIETLRRARCLHQSSLPNDVEKTSTAAPIDSVTHDSIAREAENRIEQAMFIDQMTMEN